MAKRQCWSQGHNPQGQGLDPQGQERGQGQDYQGRGRGPDQLYQGHWRGLDCSTTSLLSHINNQNKIQFPELSVNTSTSLKC